MVRSASGGSPVPTRCTWRPSTRIRLPHRRVGEGDDPRCAVKGPHGAAMIEESRSPSATVRASGDPRGAWSSRDEARAPGGRRRRRAREARSRRRRANPTGRCRRPNGDVERPSSGWRDPTRRARRWRGWRTGPGRSGGRAPCPRGCAGGRRRWAQPPARGAWRSSRARSTRSNPGYRPRRTSCPGVRLVDGSSQRPRHAARAGPHDTRRLPPGAGRVRIANTSGPSARSIRPASGRTASRYSASSAGPSRVSHRSPPPGFGIDSKRGPARSLLDGGPVERSSNGTGLLRGIRPSDLAGVYEEEAPTVPLLPRSRAIGRRGDISLPHRCGSMLACWMIEISRS